MDWSAEGDGGKMRGVRAAVSLLLIALLLWWVDLGAVVSLLSAADPGLLMLAVAVAAVDRAVMIAKWWPLLRVQSLPIGLWRAARACLIGNFASMFLPSSVGGDVVRAVALGRRDGVTMEVGASIVMERIAGILGMAAILLVAFSVGIGKAVGVERFGPYIVLFSIGAIATAWLPFTGPGEAVLRWLSRPFARSRWAGTAQRFAAAYGVYSSHRRLVLGVTAVSAVEQLFPVVVYAVVSAALGLNVGFLTLLVVVPITMLSGRIPIAMGGLGVEEGVFVYLLGLFGVDPAAALSLSVGRRVVESVVLLPGALFWADLSRVRRPDNGPSAGARAGL